MALESGTYINALNASNPTNTDSVSEADNHIRLIKATIKATFPNLTAAVTMTAAEINSITSIDTRLTAAEGTITSLSGALTAPSGTTMLFLDTAVPSGWNQVTTNDNKAIRVVSGSTGGSTGGSQTFTSAFSNQTVSGSVTGTSGSTGLTQSQMPRHKHDGKVYVNAESTLSNNVYDTSVGTSTIEHENSGHTVSNVTTYYASGVLRSTYTGGTSTSQTAQNGAGHTHSAGTYAFSDTIDLRVQYVDAIVGQKV